MEDHFFKSYITNGLPNITSIMLNYDAEVLGVTISDRQA